MANAQKLSELHLYLCAKISNKAIYIKFLADKL
jgi:hypothetical protein